MKKQFFPKKCLRTLKPARSMSPKCFEKKIPVGRIIPPFFFESSESDRVFNYLHDSNSIFRAAGINSETVSGGTVVDDNAKRANILWKLTKICFESGISAEAREKTSLSGKPDQKNPHGPMIWMVMQRNVWSDIAGWRKTHSSNCTKL